MKKIAIILFVYSFKVLANDVKNECLNTLNFEVFVKNNTKSECTVIQQDLRHGYLQKVEQFFLLKSNEEKKVSTLRTGLFERPDMVMTYQCGVDKFVTIESQQDYGLFDQGLHTRGFVLSVANMDAIFTIEDANCEKNKSAKIFWTLY